MLKFNYANSSFASHTNATHNCELYLCSALELRKKIKIGQIVEINLRNKNISGLVLKIEKNKNTKYKLKEINKILYPEILITKQQTKLIDFMFDYYLSAKSISLKSILPIVPKKYKNIKKSSYAKASEDKQKLILVPEIELIDKVISEKKLDEKKVLKIYSGIAKTKLFKNYLDILNGQEKIIVGTKISVLLPFSNLSEIIIYDEPNWNHKQSDINPRFDAREIANWLTNQHKCKIKFIDSMPSVEKYYKNTRLRQGYGGQAKTLKKNIIIINLKSERLKGNYSFLSEKLVAEIKNNLAQKNKIFIFHNRKGLANYVFCEKCNYVFKCPECALSLAYHSNDQQLHCHSCPYKTEIAPFCPKCQSSELKFKGQGVEKIKNELAQEFNNAKIQIFDKKTKLSNPNYDILIGTEFALNKINFTQFNLIAFTNFDQLLYHPDFRASEHAWQIFHKITAPAPEAKIILQTSEEENFVIQSIGQNKPELFYKTELENRKIFNYPPFVKLIKLSFQDIREKNVIYKTKKIALEISAKGGPAFGGKNIEVLGPLENHPKKIRNKFKYNIILKTPLNFEVKKLLKFIPNDFVVDVDPERI
ncbi:primosomal protein N' [Patescibacteria group bacterium]|nr:primosomal protein N' [Patescibacteria group bacterium]